MGTKINQYEAPLTSTLKPLPSRIKVAFDGQNGMVALDHIRSITKSRIVNYMGKLKISEIQEPASQANL